MIINKNIVMKELRYLVFFDKYGYYAQKQSKDTEDWTFTRKISESKRHKTIHGAFIRLDYAKNLPEFDDVNRGILVEQVETIGNKKVTKLVAKMSYKTMDKLISEEVIEQPEIVEKPKVEKEPSNKENTTLPEVDPNKVRKLNEGTEPKKRRGRPRKIPTVPPEDREQLNEGTEPKKRRGRPPVNKNKSKNGVHGGKELKVNEPKVDIKVNEPKEELTNIVDEKSHVKVAKISAEDSFWD
jgi:hypothetical protein